MAVFLGMDSHSFANDGGIAFGGSPGLLNGHPSVSMSSELIRIEVSKLELKADCTFVFVNHGPACEVRMGFPDQGLGALDPDEESLNPAKSPPKNHFSVIRVLR
jgi:hypothetical protein